MREILFRGKRVDNGEWVEGYYVKHFARQICPIGDTHKGEDIKHLIAFSGFADWNMPRSLKVVEVIPETVGQYTGLTDKNGNKIFEGDITKLVLSDGEIRYFKVSIKSVTREVVCHPDFDDTTSKVNITGVVFEWDGYELFPCINTNGVPDYKMMEVIGNIHDNPELLEDENK